MTLQNRHSKSFIKRFPYDSQRTRGPNLGYDFLQHASTHMPVTPGPRVPRRVLSAVQGIPVNRGSIPGGFQLHFSGARVPFYSENHSRSNPSPFFLYSGPSHVSLSKMFPLLSTSFPPFFLVYNLDCLFSLVPAQRLPLPTDLDGFLRKPQVLVHPRDSSSFHALFSVRNFVLATGDYTVPSWYNCIVTGSALQSRDYIDCMVQHRHRCDGWGTAYNY